MSEHIDYSPRELAALGATPGICRALSPERTYMCTLDAGHEGDHQGFELPTIMLDEIDPSGTFCPHGWHLQNPDPCPDCWGQNPAATEDAR